MNGLTLDLQLKIFSNLDLIDLVAARSASKRWKAAADSNFIWKRLLSQHFPELSENEIRPSFNSMGFRKNFLSRVRRFSPNSKHAGMQVSNDGCTARSTGLVKNWGTIRLDFPKMKSGVHYCEFITDEFLDRYLEKTWKLIIGVVSDQFEYTDEGKYIGYNQGSFGYIAQTGQKIGGAEFIHEAEYGPNYGRGSRIGVLVDFNRDEISFYKDGQYLGVAFNHFKQSSNSQDPTFYFAVSMIRSGMQVSVVPNAARPQAALEDEMDVDTPSEHHAPHRRLSLSLQVPMPMVSVGGSSPYPAGELAAVNPNASSPAQQNNTSTSRRRRRRASIVAAHDIGLTDHAIEVTESGKSVSMTATVDVEDVFPEDFSFIEESPPEIKIAILSHLAHQDLRVVRLVSKMWHQLSDSDPVWAPTLRNIMPEIETVRGSPQFQSMRSTFFNSVMRFSSTHRTAGLEVSNDGKTLTSSPSVTYWAAARVDHPVMRSGVHYGEFRVDAFRHGSIGNTWKVVIGIVSPDFEFKLAKWVGVDERSFGYIAQNGKKVGPASKNQGAEYGETYQENDRVGILVDLNKRAIRFFKNGLCQGVAFSNGPEWAAVKNPEFYFAVSLARQGMKVTACKYEYLGDMDSDLFDPRNLMQDC